MHEQRDGVHGLPRSFHRATVNIEELLMKEQDPLTKALMSQVLSDEGWSVMEFIQRHRQHGFGRSGVEEANRLLSVWGVRNMPHCAMCNEGMRFIGFDVNHKGLLRFCWQCLPCTWKYDRIIQSKAPAPDPDEQQTISDTPCLDIALLVPRDEQSFHFAGPSLSMQTLARSHLLRSP